jgi:hypothetical protein
MRDLYIPNHPRKEVPSLPRLSDAHGTSYQWMKHGFSLCWTVDWTSLLVQLMTCEQIRNEIMSNLCNKMQQNFVETEFFLDKTKQSWMNLCCRPYGNTHSHPSSPMTQWRARYFFFPVFSWDHKINHFTFCVWMDIGYVQHAFTQGVFKKVEMCQIAKKFGTWTPIGLNKLLIIFFHKPQMSSNLPNNFDLMMMVSSHSLLLKKVAQFG